MNSNEWPLVFFTLFSQASAGIMLAVCMMYFLMRADAASAWVEYRRTAAMVALVLMGMALVISFLHLSRPLASVFAVTNLQVSWLSREIILAGIFFLLTAILLLFQGNAAGRWGEFLTAGSGLVGLLLVYSMVRLYMIPTVPVWNNPSTPLAFFSSTLLLGTLAGLVVMVFLAGRAGHADLPQHAARLLVVLVIAGAVLQIGNSLYVWFGQTLAEGSFPPPELPVMFRVLQALLMVAGMAAMVAWYLRGMPLQGHTVWLYVAVAGIFSAELLGRFIFYASYYRLGV